MRHLLFPSFQVNRLGHTRPNASFSFADVPGLVLDINPAQGVYTDAARTTPVSADGDAVGGVADQSGSGNHAAQSTALNKPTYKTNIANGKPAIRFSTDDYLDITGLASNTDLQGAAYVVFRRTEDTSNLRAFLGSGDQASTNRFWIVEIRSDSDRYIISLLQQNADTLGWYKGGTHINKNEPHIATWKSSGTAWTIALDGANEPTVVGSGSNNGDWLGDTSARDNFTVGALYISPSPSFFLGADILRILYYNTVTSAGDEALILAELASLYGRTIVTKHIVCDGDSLTAGTSTETPYPTQLEALLGSGWRHSNMGVSGQTIVDMASDAATQVDTQKNSNLSKNVLCAWGSTNDLVFGAAVATVQTDYQNYCSARRTAGFQVVAFTILPRSANGTPAGFEADRQTFNTWLRANWSSFADALADVAADSRIGDAGDELDTTYYQTDKVHLNTTGHGVVAGIVQTAVNGLL